MKTLIGRWLSFVGNAALTRTMAVLTGSIGWVNTGLWAAIDIAGSAYRVTIPAVIQVSVLRQKCLYKKKLKKLHLTNQLTNCFITPLPKALRAKKGICIYE